MCYTVSELHRHIKENWAEIVTSDKKGNPGINPKLATEKAFQIYKNIISDCPFMILGPNRIRSKPEYAKFGLCTSQTKGSILGERQWSLLINDIFILGGIHQGKEFQLHLEDAPSRQLIWNETANKLTTIGRELAILKLGGYKRSQSIDKICRKIAFKQSNSSDLRLPEVLEHLKTIKKPDNIYQFIADDA